MSRALHYIFSFPFYTASSDNDGSFPYHEPGVVELLILLSFIFFLNVVRTVADYYLYAGIIAEIVLGMVYGDPLAGILPSDWEGTFTVLGYLGLIGIVFEGGLSTDLSLLVANLPLSILCACVGIALPVAFSFALLYAGYNYHPLEAFAAGAALCSTSLGTTLMALNSVTNSLASPDTDSNMVKVEKEQARTVNGAVSAAVPPCIPLSDTPSTLPPPPPPLQKSRIGTILISAAVLDDVIGLVLSSLVPALSSLSSATPHTRLAWTVVRPLLASALMAAIAPLVARFVLRPAFRFRRLGERWCAPRQAGRLWGSTRLLRLVSRPGSDIWGTQGHADAVGVTLMILLVSAFAAIAFYTGSSVLFGAYLAGLTVTYLQHPAKARPSDDTPAPKLSFEATYARTVGPLQQALLAPLFFASIGYGIPFLSLWRPKVLWRGVLYALLMAAAKLAAGLPVVLWAMCSRTPNSSRASPIKESLCPALFIGVAMVARGEIGLLIAQIARGAGDAPGLLGDEVFLVCIWAILLCTLFSPIGVGYIVHRWQHHIVHGIWA
ncbi:Sodium/hydrogen exchanger [Phanerochaete sordida]|uniref:Sodium/hydrogen exchanger n=1 Tax=Phanerochaete sordida TaxID=48140 RepID=A0A9P3L7T2_9APHY|nr:Sodium/hydrogen exchanger [Phanerochaete sordida]